MSELLVSDLARSLRFWCGVCGFSVVYDRPEERFAYLDRSGSQVMLEEEAGPGRKWITGFLEKPFGRGINLQISVDDVLPILTALDGEGVCLYLEPENKWYRVEEGQTGIRQFIGQDPDGYLLRFSQTLGSRGAV